MVVDGVIIAKNLKLRLCDVLGPKAEIYIIRICSDSEKIKNSDF